MKYLLALSMIISLNHTFAASTADQDSVAAVLDQMVREKVISAAEAEKAKIRMKGMDQSQWTAMNQKAQAEVSRMPASVPNVAQEDLEGAQLKQIEDDMRRMMPERR